jgi:hypothetical protein
LGETGQVASSVTIPLWLAALLGSTGPSTSSTSGSSSPFHPSSSPAGGS